MKTLGQKKAEKFHPYQNSNSEKQVSIFSEILKFCPSGPSTLVVLQPLSYTSRIRNGLLAIYFAHVLVRTRTRVVIVTGLAFTKNKTDEQKTP